MKHLNNYITFDWNAFQHGKSFVCVNLKPWIDYETQKKLGTKAELVIIQDDTNYNLKPGDNSNNLYEKFTVKINKEIDNIPLNSIVQLQKVNCTVYGEFRNQLSCTAENLVVIANDKT